ncbi:MAG: hypothetical protein EOP02_06835 [Proteobacteria bacterium]|nr:MAG: hypothetical protein EOP02_06835 [Pseudomonadota bacterium]
MQSKRSLTLLSLFSLLFLAQHAAAEELTPLDRFWVGAGVYDSDNDLDIRIDGEDLVDGTEVNFQRDFGFDEKELATTVDAGFTLANRHQFTVSGHRYSSSASRTLDETYDVDDQQFVVDADFDGDLDISIMSVGYTYFFHSNERSAFGVGLGGVRYAIDADMVAAGVVDDGEGGVTVVSADVSKSESAWAPMLRVQYSQMLGDQWRLHVELAGVKKSNGSVQGDAIDASVSVDYFPWEHFGFSLRYNYNDVDLDYTKSSYNGRLNLKNQGPSLLAIVRF